MRISEPDWKLLKQIRALALERLCERLLAEASGIATRSQGAAHERYREMFELIHKRDRELGDAFDFPRRSTGLLALMRMYALGLITEGEF